MSRRYYAALDSVRFDGRCAPVDRLDRRRTTATASLMLDMLLERVVPVLSENQALDNAYLLDVLGRRDADSQGLLALVRQGRLRVALLPRGGDAVDEPGTLLGAVLHRLDGPFHFSAWPELTDPAAREELAEALRRRSAGRLSGELARRAEALLDLDASLRASRSRDVAEPAEASALTTALHHQLLHLGERAPARLREHAPHVARRMSDARPRGRVAATRTEWYEAVEAYADEQGLAGTHPVRRQLTAVVDLHYNRLLAASLGAVMATAEEDDTAVAESLVDSTGVGARADVQRSLLMPQDSRSAWLEWRDLAARMEQSDGQSFERVVADLESDRVLHLTDRHWAVSFVRTIRSAGPAIGAGFGTDVAVDAGMELGTGLVAAGVEGLAGAVLGPVMLAALRRLPLAARLGDATAAPLESLARRFTRAQVVTSSVISVPSGAEVPDER